MNDYFNPPTQLQKNQNKIDISGEKGNYHLEYLDKDLFKYKFDITCNQVPIPYGVKLDNGDVSMFRNKGNNNSKKNIIPSFKPLGGDLLKEILPKFLEKKREREPKARKKTKNDDEEYKPTKKELDEISEEKKPPQNRSKRSNNKKKNRGGSCDEEYIPTQKELKEAQEEKKLLKKKVGKSSSSKNTKEKKSGFGVLMRGLFLTGKKLYERYKLNRHIIDAINDKVEKSSSSKNTEEKKSGIANFFAKTCNFIEGWRKAHNYVQAILDLPPTHTIGEKFDFEQIVPDPEDPDSIQRKIDAANKAEAEWLKWQEENFIKK